MDQLEQVTLPHDLYESILNKLPFNVDHKHTIGIESIADFYHALKLYRTANTSVSDPYFLENCTHYATTMTKDQIAESKATFIKLDGFNGVWASNDVETDPIIVFKTLDDSKAFANAV